MAGHTGAEEGRYEKVGVIDEGMVIIPEGIGKDIAEAITEATLKMSKMGEVFAKFSVDASIASSILQLRANFVNGVRLTYMDKVRESEANQKERDERTENMVADLRFWMNRREADRNRRRAIERGLLRP